MSFVVKLILDLDSHFNLVSFQGLEYIIEVQQTDRNKGAFYTCRLCSQFFDGPENLESIKKHLQMLSHKIRYLVSQQILHKLYRNVL